ncbi:MAG: NADH dehydrogenase [Deltaproteobacteria bacterium GWA2_54_12]|nr:MAG: NADH dehydrogenase [Deltaproteobacteria bacterium GWA2_54_12]
MEALFYVSGTVAMISTLRVVTGKNAVHALLYLVVSLLAAALVFYSLGAPFIAALEVIIYAGAIMVLFVFVIMMLNLGPGAERQKKGLLDPKAWAGPALLALVLVLELLYLFAGGGLEGPPRAAYINPKAVALALFGPYFIGVELASLLLLAALVAAWHLGRREKEGIR